MRKVIFMRETGGDVNYNYPEGSGVEVSFKGADSVW